MDTEALNQIETPVPDTAPVPAPVHGEMHAPSPPLRRRATLLPFAPPTLGDEEAHEIVETLRSGWITTGPRTARFEQDFAEFVGAPGAVGMSSCTAGLQTALAVAGVEAGDVVITTTLTFPGTANAIEHVGARTVLVDVEADTLNIDPAAVVQAIERAQRDGLRVRALMPVHYAGHPCSMDALDAVAAEHGLLIVEDAAHALPATIGGRLIGGRSRHALTSFSFYANKNLTTGEGGMLTGPPELLERARIYRNHGLSRDPWTRDGTAASWRYEVHTPGYKFNMTDLQAALGLHQLAKLPAFHARRAEIAERYSQAFADEPALETPAVRDGVTSAWHLYPLRLRLDRLAIDRDAFLDELAERRIGSSVHFVPVHRQPYYRDRYALDAAAFPVAEDAFSRLVSLPIYPRLTDDDADDVVAAVLDIVARHRR